MQSVTQSGIVGKLIVFFFLDFAQSVNVSAAFGAVSKLLSILGANSEFISYFLGPSGN